MLNLTKLLSILIIQCVLLLGCSNTDGQIIGFVNGVLGRTTIEASDVTVPEGQSVEVVLNFDKALSAATNFDWSLDSSLAEFSQISGRVLAEEGSQSARIAITSINNSLGEGNRRYLLNIKGSSSEVSNEINVSVEVIDDDTEPTLTISNVSISEGTGAGSTNLLFNVTASHISSNAVTVDYQSSDLTAVAGTDYSMVSGTVTIPAGSTLATISVPISRDAITESDETFKMTLSGGAGYNATGSTLEAIGTILNDDLAPTLSIADITLIEGTGAGTTTAVFTVTASGLSASDINVLYATSNGTATSPADYANASGAITILAGQLTTTISVDVVRDSLFESSETFTVTLSGGSGYTATGSDLVATATITNDDTTTRVWDFNSSLNLTFDPEFVDLLNGSTASLKTVVSTFNSATTFNTGSHSSTVYSSSALRLDSTTGGDPTLSASWSPHWTRLVGLWRFAGNWNSSGSTSLTFTPSGAGASIASTNPAVGTQHAAFNGTDSASTASFAQNFSTGMTAMAWVRPTTATADRIIIEKGSGTDQQLRLRLLSTNRFECSFSNGTSVAVSEASSLKTYAQVWSHVACVYDPVALTLSVYVDSLLRNSTAVAIAPTANSSALNLGGPVSNFTGSLDEVALFSNPFSAADINLIFHRQKQRYSGLYVSKVIDMGTTAPWPNLTSQSSFPAGKQMVAAGQNESSAYSGISGTLSTGLIGYWKFDEVTWNGTFNQVVDSSGAGNHGTSSGGAVTTAYGKLGRAGHFASANSVRTSPGTTFIPATNSSLSVSAWIFPTAISSDTSIPNRIISIHRNAGGTSSAFAFGLQASDKLCYFNYTDLSFPCLTTSIGLNVWTHVAITYNGTCFQMYLNGNPEGSCLVKSLTAGGTAQVRLASFDGTTQGFNGYIDELAFWNRALTAAEIKEVARRTLTDIKYQVRSCVDIACECRSYSVTPAGTSSDCDGDGHSNDLDTNDTHKAVWLGADGTGTTFFSELHNNQSVSAAGLPTGSVLATGLNLNWSGTFFTAAARPTANRFFRYRILMESADTYSLCSGSPCMPEVTAITVGPATRYYGGSPTVINSVALAATEVSGLTRIDTGSCTTYQISEDDGMTWLWWTAGAWTPTVDGVAHSNYLSDFTMARLQLLGSASFKFKAFLNTNTAGDFTQSCDLDQVEATYLP